MADIRSINGLPINDSIARELIETLQSKVEVLQTENAELKSELKKYATVAKITELLNSISALEMRIVALENSKQPDEEPDSPDYPGPGDDIEEPEIKYGNVVVSKTSITILENDSLTFTVKLDSSPSYDQEVILSIADLNCATLDKYSLIFTPSNYSTKQEVTIYGVHDSDTLTAKTTTLNISTPNATGKTLNVKVNNIDTENVEPETPVEPDPETPIEPSDPEIPVGSSKVSSWFESAGIEWSNISGATGYNVYYKSSNGSYIQLDDELIRTYPNNMRADILGLKAGKYVAKIVPIINKVENTSKQIVTNEFTVQSHTREGFAFSEQSTMKTSSGGYNDDGTVPSNAQILYVNSSNFNTVTLGVIKDSKGTIQSCTGLVNILAVRQKGYDKTPLIIRIVGEVESSDISGLNSNGYLQLKGCYNTTLEGVGKDATINGWGLLVRSAKNIEIRNLGIMLFPDDAVSLDTDNENIWVHHNDIFYGTAGSDSDQAKGDGSTDVKGKSTYVTISYNKYWDSGKCSLCGMTESAEFFVTYHHNWFCKSDSRHPRIRVGTVHIYNNFFDGNSKYGVGVTMGSSAFVEANDFDCCKYPMLISKQGTDIASDSSGTFSGEDGGMIKAYNNKITGASRLVYAQENSTEFDAYLASSRNEIVSSSYKTKQGGTNYNNFDTNSSMYKYNADNVDNVRNIVMNYAGRMEKGDFEWTFTSADNTSYGIISGLMNKIKSYKSLLVSYGGNGSK